VPPQRRVSRELIQEAALAMVERSGLTGLTFQALADRLGVSKQAILYWYPSKWELIADCGVPILRQEADALIGALAGSRDGHDAIERFIRAFAGHYAKRLPLFRIVYMPEPLGVEPNAPDQQAALAPIHRVTSSIYAALETWIAGDPSLAREDVSPRQLAVAVHMSAVGLVAMFALADAYGDPMVHTLDKMIDAMVALHRPRPDAIVSAPAKGRRVRTSPRLPSALR
jgi:AcrR family transcriptional regulator